MKSLINRITAVNILKIFTYLDDVNDIINFNKAYPQYEELTTKIITYLYSSKLINVTLQDIVKFNNIITSSVNVIVKIENPNNFLLFKKFKRLKHMNFDLGTFTNEMETIRYLEMFLGNLPDKLHDKTYRLLFEIVSSVHNMTKKVNTSFDNISSMNYAYIFDRGYFTFANSNQIRHIGNVGYYTATSDIIYSIEELLIKYLHNKIIYSCVYTGKSFKCYKNDVYIKLNLFDLNETNSIIKDSIIVLIKGEGPKDIYYSCEIIKEWSLNRKQPTYVTQGILNLILTLYCDEKKLIIEKHNKSYMKIWDDPIFCKYFDKNTFIKMYDIEEDENNKKIIHQYINNKVEFRYLIIFILNYCSPLDKIKSEYLYNLVLPLKKSYIE